MQSLTSTAMEKPQQTRTSKKAKPMTIAEMLCEVKCLLSKDAQRSLRSTSTKKPLQTRTSLKVKPMTNAQMLSEMKSLQVQSPKKNLQASAPVKKKWNSSCKIDNSFYGQIKDNLVRSLNLPREVKFANSRIPITISQKPIFPKPEIKTKKPYHLQARSTIRTSGANNTAETPAVINKSIKSNRILANKENISNQPNISKKFISTPKLSLRKRVMARVTDTSLSNESWKSSCDDSFLQNEQDIGYIKKETNYLNSYEPTLDSIVEVTTPASTPVMNSKNVCQNDTIMCFDNTVSTENGKREESEIVSPCDMLKKAAVSNTKRCTKVIKSLLEVQKKISEVKFANSRIPITISQKPIFPKPEIKTKKPYHLQARSTIRTSGVNNTAETPAVINKSIKSNRILANKENISNQPNISKKFISTPKLSLRKRVMARVTDTSLSNESWKSSCDDSFLQNEQDIGYIKKETNYLNSYEPTLDSIVEVTTPASTPVMNSKNVCQNDTIMCFDNTVSTENGKREESEIVSPCDMLKKAAVSNTKRCTKVIKSLLEVQKKIENNIKIHKNSIQTLNSIEEFYLKTLHSINKHMQEKENQQISESGKEKTILPTKEAPKDMNKLYMDTDNSEPCSVIKKKQKSPSDKPTKYTCIRKKLFHKSLPQNSGIATATPRKPPGNIMGAKALSMYRQMKKRYNYLTTPLKKQRPMEVPNTPSITSYNLQMQLGKLYNENQ